VLSVLTKAFDDAWTLMAHKSMPHEQELARETLAKAMMSITREASVDGRCHG
jgi:hypothetical protein